MKTHIVILQRRTTGRQNPRNHRMTYIVSCETITRAIYLSLRDYNADELLAENPVVSVETLDPETCVRIKA